MRNLSIALLAAGMSLVTAPAFAFMDNINLEHFYIEGKAGIPLTPHPEITLKGPGVFGPPINSEYRPDEGLAVGGAIGAYFMPNWRGEIEFSWTNGEDGDLDFGVGASLPHSGEVDVYTTMLNVYREFDLNEWFRPFFGGGAGFSIIDIDDIGAVGGAFTTDDKEAVFVAAAHIGADFPINEMFVLSARYTAGYQSGAEFDTTAVGVTSVKDEQLFQFISFGLRIHFN